MNYTSQSWVAVDHMEYVHFILRKERGQGKVRDEDRQKKYYTYMWKGQMKCQKGKEQGNTKDGPS